MNNRDNYDTEQSLKFDENGKFTKGTGVPAGFNKHPENRHCGSWHKEDTARYKMEIILKMSDEELEAVREDKEKTSFERAFANVLYLSRTATNIEEAQKCMVILEKMVNQVYGQMPQVQVAVEADDETQEEANKFIRGFALP